METNPHEQLTPIQSQVTAPNDEQMKRLQLYMILGGVLFLVLLIVAIALMASHPAATAVVRDIAIVFVALETFVVGAALVVLLFQLQSLIRVLRDEIQPLLHSLNETANTVRGTSEFVSQHVAEPVIKVASFTAGVQRVLSDLVAVGRGFKPKPKA